MKGPLLLRLALLLPLTAQAQFPLRLDPGLPGGRDVLADGFQFSPDGSELIFLANRDSLNQVELYRIAEPGGAVTRINQDLVPNGNVSPSGLQYSPNGEQVLYLADQRTNGVDELFLTSLPGGQTRILNLNPVNGGDVFSDGIQFSPNGAQVLYRSDQLQDGAFSLFLAQTNSPVVRQLNSPLAFNRDVSETGFQFSPNGSQILYHSDERADEVFEVFSVSATSSQNPIPLNGNLVAGGDVSLAGLQFTPDSSRVIYVADQNQNEVFELFTTPATSRNPTRISGNLVSGGDVVAESVQVSPDGERVLYLADQRVNNFPELFVTRADGTGLPLLISGDFGSVDLEGLQWSPDSRFVLFFGRPNGINAPAIPYLASLTDIRARPLLNPQQGSDANALIQRETLQFANDSSRLYYLAARPSTNRRELFSARVLPAGNSLAEVLNPALPLSGDVIDFQLQSSPAGDRVVYLADQLTNDVFELFSVNVASGLTFRLNSPPPLNSDVTAFRVSPDGQRVLYLADAIVNEQRELFLSRVETRWIGPDGNWFQDDRWSDGSSPRDGVTTAIHNDPSTITIGSPTVTGELELGTGSSGGNPSGLRFLDGNSLTLINGLRLQSNALISGHGRLITQGSNLTFPLLTTIEVAAGEALQLDSQTVTNRGSFGVTGTPENRATFTSSGLFLNQATVDEISAQSASLSFLNGFRNEGRVAFLAGENEIIGSVRNEFSGSISVAASTQLVLQDDYQGAGILGPGRVIAQAGVRPLTVASDLAFGGDLTLADTSQVTLIAAQGDGSQILTVAGELALGGELVVQLGENFRPASGDTVPLFQAGTVTGDFAILTLPQLPAGLFWDTSTLATTGVLGVITEPVSYADFAQFFNLTGTFDEDDDGDGISNSLEYLFGLNPNEQNPTPQSLTLTLDPAGEDARKGVTITATLNSPSGRDTLVAIEATSDLSSDLSDPASWSPLAIRTNGVWSSNPPVLVGPSSEGLAQISLSEDVLSDQARFYRLRISQVAP